MDEGQAIYVIPDNDLHDLNPDGLCRRCEPTVERGDEDGPTPHDMIALMARAQHEACRTLDEGCIPAEFVPAK